MAGKGQPGRDRRAHSGPAVRLHRARHLPLRSRGRTATPDWRPTTPRLVPAPLHARGEPAPRCASAISAASTAPMSTACVTAAAGPRTRARRRRAGHARGPRSTSRTATRSGWGPRTSRSPSKAPRSARSAGARSPKTSGRSASGSTGPGCARPAAGGPSPTGQAHRSAGPDPVRSWRRPGLTISPSREPRRQLRDREAPGAGGNGCGLPRPRAGTGGARIALKLMLPKAQVDEAAQEIFLREIEVTRALRHPNIVSLHDFGKHEGRFFFALEYCAGGNADELLRRQGAPLGLPTVLRLAADAIEGLACCSRGRLRSPRHQARQRAPGPGRDGQARRLSAWPRASSRPGCRA